MILLIRVSIPSALFRCNHRFGFSLALSLRQNNAIHYQENHETLFLAGLFSFGATDFRVYPSQLRSTGMAGYLTTHILDTARGCPAEGIRIELFRLDGENRQHLKTLKTNADGRTDEQILPQDAFETGTYELVFHAGDYLTRVGVPPESPRFLDVIPLRFGMSEAKHYHVPLLLSPFGYSTYRGS
jgi:5-hydroxyisourate hydrolase